MRVENTLKLLKENVFLVVYDDDVDRTMNV